METSFVYFQLLKQAMHQSCFYWHYDKKNILDQTDTI